MDDRRVEQYEVVYATEPNCLTELVNRRLKRGWYIHGRTFAFQIPGTVRVRYHQPMVRYEGWELELNLDEGEMPE